MEDLDVKILEEEFNKINLEIQTDNKEAIALLDENQNNFNEKIIKPFINYCNKVNEIANKRDAKYNKFVEKENKKKK